ncbi:MAG TPA: AraC family transcriptional regulator [Devosiaceae bacterium]|nr:AraC family transcriptional regulator [Devosiaceae bacterium]
MDPLSDVLSLLKLRRPMSFGFDAGGDWSIGFGRYAGIKIYAAVSGDCWLSVEGVPEPIHVHAGDCLMLPQGLPFRVTSDLALPAADPKQLNPEIRDGDVITHNGGGDFFSVAGYFGLAGSNTDILLGMLPPIVHIRSDADKATLRWCLERLRQELREPQPGGFLIAQQLATMMLVQALRQHLVDASQSVGWLFALADAQMGAALSAIHKSPEKRWTLQALAEQVGMSRTTFAVRFRETVGTPPMEYLTRWRMVRAGERLLTSNDTIASIALSLSYASESAFSTAFKRVMGCSPRKYGSSEALSA